MMANCCKLTISYNNYSQLTYR